MNGAIWVQLLDAYYPEEVPIQRVRQPSFVTQAPEANCQHASRKQCLTLLVAG